MNSVAQGKDIPMTVPQHDESSAQDAQPVGPHEAPTVAIKSTKGPRVRWALGALAVLVLASVFGVHYWRLAQQHINTDDAYLTADITQIAPQVNGTVTRVYVEDDAHVGANQLLVELDPSTYQANVEQAQANLQSARAQARGAAISVGLASSTGSAQITQAQGGVGQSTGSMAGAQADVQRANAGVEKAIAAAQAATANIATADAAVQAALANQQHAQDAVVTAQVQVSTARANVRVLQAALAAAQATEVKATREAERYASMVNQGAVSSETAEQAEAAAKVAQAQTESARQQVAMAQTAVSARESDVASAQEQVQAARATVAQARSAQASARYSARAAQADISQADAQRLASVQAVRMAEGRRQQTMGQLQQARTQPQQVALSASARAQAEAKVAQAQAALDAAQLQLAHTRIYAPVAGTVSQKTVEVGALVQPGTPLLALTRTDTLWVVANYKETELARIRPGERAEVVVDALDGQRFTGHVGSIAAGTGSTYALLPADNASGNFTKVIQRVPVRILLDPGQAGLDRLRAGLSVEATVNAS